VIGVEPELAGDAAESFRTGERVSWTAGQTYRTIADGLRTTSVGKIPWRQIQEYVDDIVTVGEDEIRDGVHRLAADARLVAEPSGAVPFAAYLHHAGRLGVDGNVVAVVSGGNVALDMLAHIIAPARPPMADGSGEVDRAATTGSRAGYLRSSLSTSASTLSACSAATPWATLSARGRETMGPSPSARPTGSLVRSSACRFRRVVYRPGGTR
jgi:hypothetical protein